MHLSGCLWARAMVSNLLKYFPLIFVTSECILPVGSSLLFSFCSFIVLSERFVSYGKELLI